MINPFVSVLQGQPISIPSFTHLPDLLTLYLLSSFISDIEYQPVLQIAGCFSFPSVILVLTNFSQKALAVRPNSMGHIVIESPNVVEVAELSTIFVWNVADAAHAIVFVDFPGVGPLDSIFEGARLGRLLQD